MLVHSPYGARAPEIGMSDNKTTNDADSIDARRSGADSSAASVSPNGTPTRRPCAHRAAQILRRHPKRRPQRAGPGASATERASTDAPSSASNVEPADTAQARRDEAQQAAREARASAASATAAQEAAVRERQRAFSDSKANLAQNLETATEAEAASTASRAVGRLGFPDRPTFRRRLSACRPDCRSAGLHQAQCAAFASPNRPPLRRSLRISSSRIRRGPCLAASIAARARQIFDRAGQRVTQRTLRIGVSARIFHPEPGAKGLRGKTLQYLEESIAHWVMSRDVLVFMIPTVGNQGMLHPSNIRLRDYAKHLDGLLLQGGADVSPQSYEEVTTRPEWPGDRVRDMYELELLHEFVESGKPVLGVCRGCQLINVAFGGTLYGDIATDVPTAGIHVNEQYDQHRHSIRFPDGSTLANMFPHQRDAIVNSIHHQAVRTIGRDLNIEAVSASDGIIEAVRYRKAPFVVGVQWHPEFHRAGGAELLDCTPLLDTFLRVARETRF